MPDGTRVPGPTQEWYSDMWHRNAGCGPTAASVLVWYLARSRSEFGLLGGTEGGTQPEFIALMDEMFTCVTPSHMGVNTSKIFTDGLCKYAENRGVSISCRTLEIPVLGHRRPDAAELAEFMRISIGEDRPVAFLNLSNGELRNLDNWHWVNITAFDETSLQATIRDDMKKWDIDLGRWLRSSVLGGALVAIKDSDVNSPKAS
jgi:hypothetical protein